MSDEVCEVEVADESAMERLGAAMAAACGDSATLIYLQGPLGAGKTTLVRGFLRAAGIRGAVKSPTYTLVEPYELSDRAVYHFDLYRLESAEALDMLGFRDYLEAACVCLIEWPEQAEALLPAADIRVTIGLAASGRQVTLAAATPYGARMLKTLRLQLPGAV